MSLTMKAREVAEALGVSEWSVYTAVRRHEIPNVGTGRAVRIPTRWVNERLGGEHAGGITSVDEGEISLGFTLDALERLATVARQAALLSGRDDDAANAGYLELHLAHARAAVARAASPEAETRDAVRGAADPTMRVSTDATADSPRSRRDVGRPVSALAARSARGAAAPPPT